MKLSISSDEAAEIIKNSIVLLGHKAVECEYKSYNDIFEVTFEKSPVDQTFPGSACGQLASSPPPAPNTPEPVVERYDNRRPPDDL